MKILLITQYFYPENFKSNDIAFELVKRGYEVDALVGIPNYPEGKYYQGYGLFKKRHEVVNGVHVYRVFQTPRGKGGWRLPINYFSYVLSACVDILFYFAWKKYDCVIVHEPSPIFQAYPAILLKALRRTPVYLWVLDLWPPSIMNNPSNALSRFAVTLVNKQVKFIYKWCDKLLISSKMFERHVMEHGGTSNKVVYYPNWSDDMLQKASDRPLIDLPDGFVIMMAGNLGQSQDLETISKLILETKDMDDLKWVFVGDGSQKKWLDDFIQQHNLAERCYAIGRKPYSEMPDYFSKADAFIISLKANSEQLDCVVPARLQSYMSGAKPVLGLIGMGGGKIIEESRCGYVAPPGDYKEMARIIRKVQNDREAFASLGINGREYFEKHFTKEKCIDHLCEIIEGS